MFVCVVQMYERNKAGDNYNWVFPVKSRIQTDIMLIELCENCYFIGDIRTSCIHKHKYNNFGSVIKNIVEQK